MFMDGLTGSFLRIRSKEASEVTIGDDLESVLKRCGVTSHRENRISNCRQLVTEGDSRILPTLLLPRFNVERRGYLALDSGGRDETGNWRS